MGCPEGRLFNRNHSHCGLQCLRPTEGGTANFQSHIATGPAWILWAVPGTVASCQSGITDSQKVNVPGTSKFCLQEKSALNLAYSIFNVYIFLK